LRIIKIVTVVERNNHKKVIQKWDFIKKALRDYTPHAQTAKATGDEIVQTTTLKFLAANES